jgi:hypothetical protein
LGYLDQHPLCGYPDRQVEWIREGLAVALRAEALAERELDEAALDILLIAHVPGIGPQQRKWILDATAVAAYHAQLEFPVVGVLVCDDAPQFTWRTQRLALCWVHFGEEILGVERPSPAVQCAAARGTALFMDVTVEPRLTAVGDAYYLGYPEHRSLRSETVRRAATLAGIATSGRPPSKSSAPRTGASPWPCSASDSGPTGRHGCASGSPTTPSRRMAVTSPAGGHQRWQVSSPTRGEGGEPPGTRTRNQLIKSQLLYQLS